MAPSFDLRANGELVLRDLEGVMARIQDPRPVLEDFGEHMVNSSIPENFRQEGRPEKWPRGEWSSERQQQDTTRLLQSVTFEVSATGVKVGTNLKYAAQRHFGGILEPKNARALAIPLPDVPRSMRRPRRWGDRLFMVKPTKGDANTVGILATQGRKGEIIPRFVLRRQVEQPARPFIVAQDEDLALLSRRLVEFATTGELS